MATHKISSCRLCHCLLLPCVSFLLPGFIRSSIRSARCSPSWGGTGRCEGSRALLPRACGPVLGPDLAESRAGPSTRVLQSHPESKRLTSPGCSEGKRGLGRLSRTTAGRQPSKALNPKPVTSLSPTLTLDDSEDR